MTAHPEPPKDFSRKRLPTRTFPRENAWFRIHRKKHEPLHFGTSGDNRFDAPGGEFGVLYVGADLHCAFIETFGHTTGTSFVTLAELRARELALVRASRPLRLVDLCGEGLARLGADAALTGGLDLGLAQRWSRAIYMHPSAPDGIAYRARHDPARISAAVFDRAKGIVRAERKGALAEPKHARLLAEVLETYRFGLIP